jgi:hypothetical protein
MMKAFFKWFLCATLLTTIFTVSSSAGIITHSLAFPPGPDPVALGPGLGFVSVPVVTTPFPNNDNQPGGPLPDNNVDVNNKRFEFADYIDIEFTVSPSGGTTEYRVIEFVDNDTDVAWNGYVMQLGTGFGPNFQLANPGSGLDFDALTYDTPPTSTAMTISSLAPYELVFNGFHGDGAQQYSVRIDVPDSPAVIGGLGQFTLRQFPLPVPEPGTMALVSLSLAGFAWHCRRS